MINNEPNIFKIIPMFVSLILPYLSARPPAPTTNIPENKAVILTAIFTVPISVLKLSSSIGTTLTNDCANSQNVITLKTIPINNLLLPSNASLDGFSISICLPILLKTDKFHNRNLSVR
ncbi:Uncharacterised protein [Staphylococcus aureus]|nr:Uncharacterised protein [Staphylococcus aureus]CPL80415.1 Uncharacterised protein [Staphylococcus aureus]